MKGIVYLLIFISIVHTYSCCSGGYLIPETQISLKYAYSDPNYTNSYPSWEHSEPLNYEKRDYSIKIYLRSEQFGPNRNPIIYIQNNTGQKLDSITNLRFETFQKTKCEDGLKCSFKYRNKEYAMQEAHNITEI